MADANGSKDKKVYRKPSPGSIRDLETKEIISTEIEKERKSEERLESSFDDRVRSNGFDPQRAYEKELEAAMEEEENGGDEDKNEGK